jgi:threonine/homoserine/homoserine lactone efflux protein
LTPPLLASLAFKGLLIGLSISAPIGPVGVLCIRRSLAFGRVSGWVTGLGAATADVICGCAAGFGMNSVAGLLTGAGPWLGGIGGVLVCLMGLGICFRPPGGAKTKEPVGTGILPVYGFALFVTLINPLTLLSIVAIFSGLGIGVTTDRPGTAVFIAGLALGAMLWWYLLSQAATMVRAKVSEGWMRRINLFSGLAILALGAHLVVSALK